ncbi:MAG: DUF5681 domain-containing protein [Lysobacteraceae bacterium]
MTEKPKRGGKATSFRPGQSGNPKGRPKGAPDRRNQWREALSDDLPNIVEQLKRRAANGDDFAIRLILDRVAAPLRPQGPTIELPELLAAEGLTAKAEAVLSAIASGRLPVDTGRALMESVAAVAKATEVQELTKRVDSLERITKFTLAPLERE